MTTAGPRLPEPYCGLVVRGERERGRGAYTEDGDGFDGDHCVCCGGGGLVRERIGESVMKGAWSWGSCFAVVSGSAHICVPGPAMLQHEHIIGQSPNMRARVRLRYCVRGIVLALFPVVRGLSTTRSCRHELKSFYDIHRYDTKRNPLLLYYLGFVRASRFQSELSIVEVFGGADFMTTSADHTRNAGVICTRPVAVGDTEPNTKCSPH